MKTSDSFSPYAVKRAWWGTVGFFLWACIISLVYPINWVHSWPLVLFHILLLVNTFFSIRVFASITPRGRGVQHVIDIVLGLCLLALPVTFNAPALFTLFCLLLFIIATLKYIMLVSEVGFSRLLYRKIKVDTLGILLCFFAFVGVLLGFPYISSIIFALIFLLANLYVLWHTPLYRLELHTEGK